MAQPPAPPTVTEEWLCKVCLPAQVLPAGERLREALEGRGGKNLAHLRRKYPNATITLDGDAVAPGAVPALAAQGLHLMAKCKDQATNAKLAKVLADLAETACDLVADSLGFNEEQVQRTFAAIRVLRWALNREVAEFDESDTPAHPLAPHAPAPLAAAPGAPGAPKGTATEGRVARPAAAAPGRRAAPPRAAPPRASPSRAAPPAPPMPPLDPPVAPASPRPLAPQLPEPAPRLAAITPAPRPAELAEPQQAAAAAPPAPAPQTALPALAPAAPAPTAPAGQTVDEGVRSIVTRRLCLALEAGDAEVLANAVRWAEGAGVDAAVLEHARGRRDALADAARKRTMREAARRAVAQAVNRGAELAALADAVAWAERAGVEDVDLVAARQRLTRLEKEATRQAHERREAADALALTTGGHDLEALESAIVLASAVGVAPELMLTAQRWRATLRQEEEAAASERRHRERQAAAGSAGGAALAPLSDEELYATRAEAKEPEEEQADDDALDFSGAEGCGGPPRGGGPRGGGGGGAPEDLADVWVIEDDDHREQPEAPRAPPRRAPPAAPGARPPTRVIRLRPSEASGGSLGGGGARAGKAEAEGAEDEAGSPPRRRHRGPCGGGQGRGCGG